MKTVTIGLPYYKQGDDLCSCLDEFGTYEIALSAHALQMETAALMLRQIRHAISNVQVEIIAEGHTIQITGPDDIMNALLVANLAYDEDDEYIEFEVDEVEDEVQ